MVNNMRIGSEIIEWMKGEAFCLSWEELLGGIAFGLMTARQYQVRSQRETRGVILTVSTEYVPMG